MKHLILIVTFPLAGLAYIVGSRLSDDVLLVLFGMACGVGGTLVVSMCLWFVGRRPRMEYTGFVETEIKIVPQVAGMLREGVSDGRGI